MELMRNWIILIKDNYPFVFADVRTDAFHEQLSFVALLTNANVFVWIGLNWIAIVMHDCIDAIRLCAFPKIMTKYLGSLFVLHFVCEPENLWNACSHWLASPSLFIWTSSSFKCVTIVELTSLLIGDSKALFFFGEVEKVNEIHVSWSV